MVKEEGDDVVGNGAIIWHDLATPYGSEVAVVP